MNIVLLAGLFAAALLSQTCEGSMIPEHPQTAFCKADFVVRVKILGKIKKDEGTPAPEVVPTPESTTRHEVDKSSTENPTKPVAKEKSASLQSFQKPSDLPPGEDPTVKTTGSLLGSILGRHKRSLGLGIRGAPPPPPATTLHKSPYHRPIGGQHRDKGMMYYDVLIKKVFKGGDKVRNTRGTFVDAANPKRFFARIYFSPHHGQELEAGVAYMLSGKIMDNDLVLPSRGCWLEKWKDLSREEVHGLHRKYAENCDCMINFCIPGSHCKMMQSLYPSRCAWQLRNFREPSRDCGAKHNMCTKHRGKCHWKTGHGFDSCLNSPGLFP